MQSKESGLTEKCGKKKIQTARPSRVMRILTAVPFFLWGGVLLCVGMGARLLYWIINAIGKALSFLLKLPALLLNKA